MSLNLVESVRGLLGGDLISRASTMLNEDENRVHSAMSGIVPSVLAGIIHKAGSGDAGGVLRMAKDTSTSGLLSGIGNFFGNSNLLERGAEMLKSIFGNRMSDVTNTIAGFAGIRPASAVSLMSVAAPAALGTLGNQAAANNMNANSFLSFLASQKDNILHAIPSGLNLAGALGLSSLDNIGSHLTGALPGATAQVRDMQSNVRKARSSRWLVPALVAIAAIGLLWYFQNRNSRKNNRMNDTITAERPISSPPPGRTIHVTLPNGVAINAYKDGIEDRLVAFLNDPSKQPDNSTWFDFDKLNFETGSANITADSKEQIKNIAEILKAFPGASIKIGGYTDKTGNEAANMKLSQARANAVVAALKDSGISDKQLAGAEGYGSKYAKAPADASDEERRQDRRIAVSVRQK